MNSSLFSLRLLIFSLLVFVPAVSLAEQSEKVEPETSVIQLLAEKNLASFGWEDDEWNTSDDWHVFLEQMLNRKFYPTTKGKRSKAFSLFKGEEHPLSLQNDVLIDSASTWSDLTLFCGQTNPSAYVADSLSRTYTELGKVALFTTLSSPIYDVERLKKRQDTIRLFMQNAPIMKRFEEALVALQDSEAVFLSFYHPDPLRNTIKNFLEYSAQKGSFKDSLNKSPLALSLKSTVGHAQRLQWFALGVAGAVTLTSYGLLKLINVKPPAQLAEWAKDSQGGPWSLSRLLWNRNNGLINTTLALGSGIYAWQELRGLLQWTTDCFYLEECLYKVTAQLAVFIKNSQKVYEEVRNCPEIAHFDEIKGIGEFFETKMHSSPSLQELIDLLAHDTFIKPFSLTTHKGRVVRAYTLMHEVKAELKSLATGIGKLDMYLSLAKLMQEFEPKRVQFCFPTYHDAEQPVIDLTEFWHPLLDIDTVVPNNLLLGDIHRQNMIITGPNAGGKSTILKTITLCILLAQTISLVPAQKMRLTPFTAIKTYLNIVDDIGAGNSLFMAEAKQAQRLVDRVEKQPENAFSFTCFDEVFNGTSPVEGAAAAYSVAHHLAPFKNNICIVATHFPLLTALESDTEAFKNYKVSVRYENDHLAYPFKLEEGISHQHVALDVLKQQGFEGSLLATAKKMVLLQKAPASA